MNKSKAAMCFKMFPSGWLTSRVLWLRRITRQPFHEKHKHLANICHVGVEKRLIADLSIITHALPETEQERMEQHSQTDMRVQRQELHIYSCASWSKTEYFGDTQQWHAAKRHDRTLQASAMAVPIRKRTDMLSGSLSGSSSLSSINFRHLEQPSTMRSVENSVKLTTFSSMSLYTNNDNSSNQVTEGWQIHYARTSLFWERIINLLQGVTILIRFMTPQTKRKVPDR